MNISQWQFKIHELAKNKGWWDEPIRDIPHTLCLIHSEVSEALEEYRSGHAVSIRFGPDGKPEGMGIELADVVIRVLDLAEHLNIDIEHCMKLKHVFNETRPYKHGRVA